MTALGDGSSEQTVPQGNATSFVDIVTKICQSPALAARLGEANRQRVERHFSVDSMVDRYLDLYQSLAAAS